MSQLARIREVETPSGPQLNVYARRRGALFWACRMVVIDVCLVMFVYLFSHSAEPTPQIVLFDICGVVLAPLLGWATLYFGYWAVSRRPLLTVTEDGIVDKGSIVGFGFIRWSEISRLAVYKLSQGGTVHLCIVPINTDELLRRLPFWRKLMHWTFWWSIRGPSPVLIPQALLPTSARALVERIRAWDKVATPLSRRRAP